MGAMYHNNKSTKDMFDKITDFNNDTNEQNRYTKQDMQKAYTFLKENSKDKYFKSIDSSDLSQQRYQRYFTSTKEQYEDNSLKLPITIGLQDVSYMFVPTTPLLRTTTKAGSTLTKATLKEADKIYLQTGIKTDNFIKTEVVPKVTDAYYNGKNFVYDPENIIKGMSIADTIYGAVSPEPPMTPQQLGGYLLKNYIYEPIQNSILNQYLNNEK